MKLGFFGGSFDPVHHGHLIAAQDAREQLGLDRVVFVPSFQSPLKAGEPGIGPGERADLLGLAIEGVSGFGLSTVEIDRGGISYTVETVRGLRAQYPEDELFWIIGQDQVALLPRWHRIEELAAAIVFAYVRRPGSGAPSSDVPGLDLRAVDSHCCDISSTDIRRRAGEGRPIHFLAPPCVVGRILEKGLYGAGGSGDRVSAHRNSRAPGSELPSPGG